MPADDDPTRTSKLVTYRTVIISGLIVIAGIGMLYVAGRNDWWEGRGGGQALVNQLAGILITAGGLAILWDLRGKRDVTDEVLAKVQVATDVKAAGLVKITMNWLDVDWKGLFGSSRELEVFISYGSSWRKVHWNHLQLFSSKKQNRLWVYLPDPNDDTSMRVLAQRYDYSVEKVRGSVIETAQELASLAKHGGADIRIYYRAGDPTYTCYRFDDQVLVTMYSNRRQRGDVPVFLVKAGSLSEFFVTDLAAIRRQSVAVPLADLVKEREINAG